MADTPIITRLVPGSSEGSIDATLFEQYFEIQGDELVLTYRDSSGVIRTHRFRGVSQPELYIRRAALKNSEVFIEADFLAGTQSMDDTITLHEPPLSSFLGFWQPATALTLTFIGHRLSSISSVGDNIIGRFKGPFPLNVASVDGYYWVSEAVFRVVTILQEPWDIRTQGAQFPPFPRRVAVKLTDDDFTAADFLLEGANDLSYTDIVDPPTVFPGSTANMYRGWAVPVTYPDISDLQTVISTALGNFYGLSGTVKQSIPIDIDGVSYNVWREESATFYHVGPIANNRVRIIQMPTI